MRGQGVTTYRRILRSPRAIRRATIAFLISWIVAFFLLVQFIPFPLNYGLATAVGLVAGAYWCWTTVRVRAQDMHGHCTKCGYDLTGNVTGTCPECGTEIESP